MVTFKMNEQQLVCLLKGRLSTDSCLQLETEIDTKLAEQPESVIFDIAEVDYVSSAFLRIVLKTSKKVGADHLSIIQAKPFVKKVFMIAGFDNFLQIG